MPAAFLLWPLPSFAEQPCRSCPPRPTGDEAGWITDNDYPPGLEHQQAGNVRVRLSVGPNGRVTGCDIIHSSGHWRLDQIACNVLVRRARFLPATDSHGQPVTGHVERRVRWQMPRDQLTTASEPDRPR